MSQLTSLTPFPASELSPTFFTPCSFSFTPFSSSTSSTTLSTSSFSSSSSSSSKFRLFKLLPNDLLKLVFSFLSIEEAAFKVSLVSVRFFACGNIQTQQRFRQELTYLWHKYTSFPTPFGFYLVNFAPRLLRYIKLCNPIGEDVNEPSAKRIKHSQNLSWFFQEIDFKYQEEEAEKRGIDKYKFWGTKHNPIYYINGIDKCQNKKFIIKEIYKHSKKIYSKFYGMRDNPNVAFYNELRFGGKWKSIDVGHYADWEVVLSINFPHLEVLKHEGDLADDLGVDDEGITKHFLEQMPKLTTVIDTDNISEGYTNSIKYFSFHPELKRIRTHLCNPAALANFPKEKPYPIIDLLFSRAYYDTAEDTNFKGYQIESLELYDNVEEDILEHFVGIDDITTLHIKNPASKTLTLLKRFKKLEKLFFGKVSDIDDFTPLEDPNLPITELTINEDFAKNEDFDWFISSANILPRLRVLKIKVVSNNENLKTDLNNLTVFLKTRPHLRDIHLFVINRGKQDERLNFNALWRWKGCENPAEELLTLFSDLNDGSRWIRVTYKCNKEYFAETNTSKFRQNSSFQLTLLK